MPRVEVPDNIVDDEYLGRIVLHSFHYSETKDKLRPEAFMPSPSERDEVSILRFTYTNIDFCKMRGILIAERRNNPQYPCKFIGIAFISCKEVKDAPINNDSKGNIDENFSANPIATPLCVEEKLRTDRPIYTNDEGIPCHGDIKFDIDVYEHTPIKQKYKKRVFQPLANLAEAKFFKDSNTITNVWKGDAIDL